MAKKRWSVKSLLAMLGPGLVTGAADDDPSGIATYSQGGAQFGYALGWTMFLTTPFMIAIQMVSARIGAVTGQGLAANLGKAGATVTRNSPLLPDFAGSSRLYMRMLFALLGATFPPDVVAQVATAISQLKPDDTSGPVRKRDQADPGEAASRAGRGCRRR